MAWREVWQRTLGLFRGRRREDELADEIAEHLAQLAEEHERRGLSPREARLAAQREFGGVAQTREAFRDQRRWPSIDTLFQDVRLATRALIKDRGTTFAAIALLTIGVGTTVVMADVLDRLLLREPEHVDRPDLARRLYAGSDTDEPRRMYSNYITLQHMIDGLSRDVETWGAFENERISLGHGVGAHYVDTIACTEGYFDVLGLRPALGVLPSTKRHGADDGAVISHALWQRDFGGALDVVGKPLPLGKMAYTVVAVLPRGFAGIDDDPVDVWLPLASRKRQDPAWMTGTHYIGLMGLVRLRPEVAREQAEIRAGQIYDAVNTDLWPDGKKHPTRIVFGELLPARAPGRTGTVRVLLPTAAVSTLVLLIACGNVGSLLLVRGLRRAPELALKTALGATRLRLVRETLIESLLLAFAAGVSALAFVMTAGVLVRGYFLPPMAATVVPLDARLVVITMTVCGLAAMFLSLAPALRLTRARMTTPGRVSLKGAPSQILDVFVAAQVALSVPLLIGAALFATSVGLARQDDFGFRLPHVAVVRSDLTEDGRPAEQDAAHERIRDRLLTLPGVVAASLVTSGPLRGGTCIPYTVPGGPSHSGVCAYVNMVDERFLSATGVVVTNGRSFTVGDNSASAAPVAIINEAMRRKYWPDRSPIGTCMTVDALPCVQVIGVIDDAVVGPYLGTPDDPPASYLLPIGRFRSRLASRAVVVRTSNDPTRMIGAIQRASYDAGTNLPYVDAWPLSEVLEPRLKPLQLGSTVFLALSALALAIAAAGLIVVTAHGVTRRTREMGIHLSLGATPGIVVRLMLRRTLVALAIGLVVGLGLALAGSRLFTDLLYRVEPRDPRVFAACATALLVAGTLAAWLPARRAGRIDPSVALRTE